MPVNVTVNTSPEQDAKLEALRLIMNDQRAANGQLPYDTVDDMAKGAMVEQLKGWMSMADHEEVKHFSQLFEDAGNVIRQQVMDILAPQG